MTLNLSEYLQASDSRYCRLPRRAWSRAIVPGCVQEGRFPLTEAIYLLYRDRHPGLHGSGALDRKPRGLTLRG